MKQDVMNPMTWNKSQKRDFYLGVFVTVSALAEAMAVITLFY